MADDVTQQLFKTMNGLVRPLVKAGLGSPLPIGLGAVVLETTGRVSGLQREVPVIGLRLGKRVIVSTVRERSQWLRNAETDENTAVWYCGQRHETTAGVRRGPLNIVTLDASE